MIVTAGRERALAGGTGIEYFEGCGVYRLECGWMLHVCATPRGALGGNQHEMGNSHPGAADRRLRHTPGLDAAVIASLCGGPGRGAGRAPGPRPRPVRPVLDHGRPTRPHGGDGLGPVYNERSCLSCHHQGGPGGGGGGDKNIEIITANGESFQGNGAFYSFGMAFGGAGFQYKFASNPKPARAQPPNPADLAQIHAGFREATSVVLHRFGPDADYRSWRERVPGQHGAIFIRPSQRNPTPLFGVGLIDAIPDEVIEAAARRRFAGWPQIKGRVSRLSDDRIGRFGWKAQTATLEAFVVNAAAVELGLEVPGAHQAGDPRIPALAALGLDMDRDESAPRGWWPTFEGSGPTDQRTSRPDEEARLSQGGEHGLQGDRLRDLPSAKAGRCRGDLQRPPATRHEPATGRYEHLRCLLGARRWRRSDRLRSAKAPDRKPRPGATLQEWRTPPLWGVRDSAPYLHDGRAENLDQAIRGHGGQATASAQKYAQLSTRERAQLDAFLLSLAAPKVVE